MLTALAVLAWFCALPTSVTQATHPRPTGATPFNVPLVPVYKDCVPSVTNPDEQIGPANANHVAPLSLDACAPPKLRSKVLTFAATAGAVGSVGFKLVCSQSGCPSGSQEDFSITASQVDVRCGAVAIAGCEVIPGSTRVDFTGKLILRVPLKLTDHANRTKPAQGVACPNTSGAAPCVPATVENINLEAQVQCVASGALNTAPGGSCSVTSSFEALFAPGMFATGQRSVLDIGEVALLDPGLNGTLGSADVCPPVDCGDGDEQPLVDQGLFGP